ncbi:hypothetical protein AMECASPLE_029813 [Ameca splendens]|uniref:Uncharacterized protein n=1 Tax=Ameca splendens TaxID=208324 RepID=A0ABV0XIV2_9TELE
MFAPHCFTAGDYQRDYVTPPETTLKRPSFKLQRRVLIGYPGTCDQRSREVLCHARRRCCVRVKQVREYFPGFTGPLDFKRRTSSFREPN